MYRPSCFLLIALLSIPVHAADSYTVDPTHTWPVFEVSHLGFSTQRGRFDKTSGKITLDVAARKGSIELIIETDSINMGFDKWNRQMKSVDFFSTGIFPTMRFTSDKIIFNGDKPVSAEGELTLLDTTLPVTLNISNFNCGTHPYTRQSICGADISTTIKRSDFGMRRFIPTIGDEVNIYSPVEAFKD